MTPFLAAWMPGWPEIALIVVLVLILFGPRRLPEVAEAVGKSIQRFKTASRDASHAVKKELDDARTTVEDTTADDPEGASDNDSKTEKPQEH